MILLIIILILLFGGGGGFYAHRNYGYGGSGVVGLVVIVVVLLILFGGGGVRAETPAAGESPGEFNRTARVAATKAPVATPGAVVPATSPVPCTDLLNLLPLGCSTGGAVGSSPFTGIINDAINFFASDFSDAQALATQIPALQDVNGAACWKQATSISVLLKAHPLILTAKPASDFEAMRLFAMSINQMCANPACTQVFTDLSNGIAQMGATIPIPSLTQLCSKVPTIVEPAASVTLLPTTVPGGVPLGPPVGVAPAAQ